MKEVPGLSPGNHFAFKGLLSDSPMKHVSHCPSAYRSSRSLPNGRPCVSATTNAANSNDFPFGFAGGLQDSATGLVQFGARTYDPEIGRWLERDPILHQGGINLYEYCGGDPVNWIDPSGLYTEVTVWAPIGWAASSFGHVTVTVNDTLYNLTPGAFDPVDPSGFHDFITAHRWGRGFILDLNAEEEKAFESALLDNDGQYRTLDNNCTSLATKPLAQIGLDLGARPFPLSVARALARSDRTIGETYYAGPDRAGWLSLASPWAKMTNNGLWNLP